MHLKHVDNLAVMQSVTVRVKAVLVGMPEHVQVRDSWRGLTKQECIVADVTGTIRIVLWEKKIGCSQEDRCYKVENVHIKEFQGKKYLSVPDKCTIKDIDEIDNVAEMDSDDERPTAATVVEGVVKAVLSCEEYLSCVNCSLKITSTSELVDCGKCLAKMRVSTCNTNSIARVMLQRETDGRPFKLPSLTKC